MEWRSDLSDVFKTSVRLMIRRAVEELREGRKVDAVVAESARAEPRSLAESQYVTCV